MSLNLKYLLPLLLPLSCIAQPDTLNVLFLGNSYTGSNNLPLLFTELSESGGKEVYAVSNTPGGYWLEDHLTNQTSLNLITSEVWDYVVLQEQSQVPTIEYYLYNSMYPSARELDSLIMECGGNTAFFMTWGRKRGGQQTIGSYSSPVFTDFFHMQDTLCAAYSEIALELGAVLAPVGNAWATAVTLDSMVNLWQSDGSHPTLEGSYLSACMFYAVFFAESPVGLPYTAGLNGDTALFLQNAAYLTVGVESENQFKIQNSEFKILSAYPNPFNEKTAIS